MAENERDIKKDPSDPRFFQRVKFGVRVAGMGDPNPAPSEVEDGSVLRYKERELRALGDGDLVLGLRRVMDAFNDDPRPLFEKMMDTRRPLQDELDIHFPPPAQPPVN
jgi:hypothetical protein